VSRCVFLGKNGRCKVYRFRPRACRNHSAVSPPERCMEMPGEGRTIEVAADYRPEMISAAYSTVPGVSTGGMAEMLLPRLFHD
jgi:Fe-S-cluster containining protein